MASLDILKSGVGPFSSSRSKNSRGRFIKLRSQMLINRRFMVSSNLQNSDKNESNGEEPPESMFMKELRRRGMTPTSLPEESWSTSKDEEYRYKEEDGGFANRSVVSTDFEKSLSNQRERSMALNSEGLEGLIPRAKLLLSLGGTFFLAFWPLILITVASFSAVYLYFGPKFVHDASSRQVYLPEYVDPYALLEDQRISQTAPPLN